VRSPLPFYGSASHICLKPGANTGDTAACFALTGVNASGGNPNEDAAGSAFEGLRGRLRDIL